MKQSDFQLVLKKLDIKEDDILTYEENWSNVPAGIEIPYQAKAKHMECRITLKNGREFIFKMNHLNKLIRTIDEIGYDLMTE